MEIGKYGVNPDYTEHAGTHDDNEHRYNALAHGSGRRNGTVHKCRNTMIVRRYIPAFITASSLVNRDKNALPKNTSDTPRIRPMPKEYARLMR